MTERSKLMTNVEDYIFLGFDLRLSGCPTKTVDAFLWEQALDARERVLELGHQENIAQQLDCDVEILESHVSHTTTGIAITCSPNAIEIVKKTYGWPIVNHPYTVKDLLARGWKFEGFDVADVDGFFSVFGIDADAPKLSVGKKLFESEAEAQDFIVPATSLYPTHAPFIVFGVLLFDHKPVVAR